MSAFFLTEAGRIAGQRLGKLLLRNDGINEFSDHGMLAGSDQIQIFSFDFIHHGIHFRKAHNSGHHVASDHERRHAIGKASVDHEIPRISDNGRMQSGDITHQIIKTVSCYLSGAVEINSVKTFHDFRMIRDFEIRYHRLTISLDFHVLAVVFSNRYRRINDIRNDHHILQNLFLQFSFFLFQFLQTLCTGGHFSLFSFRFFLLSCFHESANFFRDLISVSAKIICFLLGLSAFLIQSNYLIYQRQFFVLEFLSDIFFYCFRIFP